MIDYTSPRHAKDLAADLKMQSSNLSANKKHVVLVEGTSDQQIFSLIAGESSSADSVKLLVAGTRQNVIIAVRQLIRSNHQGSSIPHGLVGIIDRDMEYQEELSPRLAYVSTHHDDIESALLSKFGRSLIMSLVSPQNQNEVLSDCLISKDYSGYLAGLRLQICQFVTSLHVAYRNLHSTTNRNRQSVDLNQLIGEIIRSDRLDRSNQGFINFDSLIDRFELRERFPEKVIREAADIHSRHADCESRAARWRLCHGKYLVSCLIYYLDHYYKRTLNNKQQTIEQATRSASDLIKAWCDSDLFDESGLIGQLSSIRQLDGSLNTNYLGLLG